MEIERRNRNPHRDKLKVDLIHIMICVAIIALAIFGFSNVEQNIQVFSMVFALAALLNFVNGIPLLKRMPGGPSRVGSGVFLCLVGLVLVGLAVLSLIAFW